jgi:hypothetical protein
VIVSECKKLSRARFGFGGEREVLRLQPERWGVASDMICRATGGGGSRFFFHLDDADGNVGERIRGRRERKAKNVCGGLG